MSIKQLLLLAALFAISTGTLRADDTNLVLRLFPISSDFISGDPDYYVPDDRSGAEGGATRDHSRPTDIKEFYRKCGVSFPKGAYIAYNPKPGLLEHFNTEPNQKLFGKILVDLCPITPQVRLDAAFVDFPRQEIEKLARANSSPFPRSEDILQLWENGQGTLLHALKLVTQSGVNAQIQAVSEHIYATEFKTTAATNATAGAAAPLPVPDLFETREAGAIFNVTPTFDRTTKTIQVVMAPELTSKPEWQSLAVAGTDAHGKKIHLSVPQPLFHSRNITTSFVMTDQSTQVFGGMENPHGEGVTYLFLTVTLIDASGQPLADYASETPH